MHPGLTVTEDSAITVGSVPLTKPQSCVSMKDFHQFATNYCLVLQIQIQLLFPNDGKFCYQAFQIFCKIGCDLYNRLRALPSL